VILACNDRQIALVEAGVPWLCQVPASGGPGDRAQSYRADVLAGVSVTEIPKTAQSSIKDALLNCMLNVDTQGSAHGQLPVFLKYISKNLKEGQRLHSGVGHKTMPYF
jgi:hypothetical protein